MKLFIFWSDTACEAFGDLCADLRADDETEGRLAAQLEMMAHLDGCGEVEIEHVQRLAAAEKRKRQ